MGTTFIFGMNATQINFWAMLAQWFAAFGTIAAVIVALWLSFREQRFKLIGSCTLGSIVDQFSTVEVIMITITNHSQKSAIIDSINWKLPNRECLLYQLFNDSTIPSEVIPCRINENERKSFLVKLEYFDRNITEQIVKEKLTIEEIKKIKVLVTTTVNKNFEMKLQPELQKWIIEHCFNESK